LQSLDARGFGGLIPYGETKYYPLYEWPPKNFTYFYKNHWSVACGVPEFRKMPLATPPHADLGPHYKDLTWAFTVSDAFLPHPRMASNPSGRIIE
jgi:hypothetical protein